MTIEVKGFALQRNSGRLSSDKEQMAIVSYAILNKIPYKFCYKKEDVPVDFIPVGSVCSCCSDENHYRGPFKSEEDANRRISYFKAPNSKFWPVASQYSKRGNYSIKGFDVEWLPDGRAIIEDTVYHNLTCITVADDGSVEFNQDKFFGMECY